MNPFSRRSVKKSAIRGESPIWFVAGIILIIAIIKVVLTQTNRPALC